MLKKFFQKFSKAQLIAAGIGLLLLVLLMRAVNVRQVQKKNVQRSAHITKVTDNGNAIVVKQAKDKHTGVVHTIIKEVPVMSTADKDAAVGAGYIDTVSKALDVAVDKIAELTKANGTLIAKVKLLEKRAEIINEGDTPILTPLKVYTDKWLYAAYDPATDSLGISYNVTLNTVKYTNRKTLLSAKQQYINLWSDDPRVTIGGVKRFETDITPRPKRFGLGPSISYTYDFSDGKFRPMVGLGLQYNIIRF